MTIIQFITLIGGCSVFTGLVTVCIQSKLPWFAWLILAPLLVSLLAITVLVMEIVE